jgi:Trp operon repressor
MPNNATNKSMTDDLLRDLLILQLILAGISQHEVRKIVGVEMARVTRIAKPLKKARGVDR